VGHHFHYLTSCKKISVVVIVNNDRYC